MNICQIGLQHQNTGFVKFGDDMYPIPCVAYKAIHIHSFGLRKQPINYMKQGNSKTKL